MTNSTIAQNRLDIVVHEVWGLGGSDSSNFSLADPLWPLSVDTTVFVCRYDSGFFLSVAGGCVCGRGGGGEKE